MSAIYYVIGLCWYVAGVVYVSHSQQTKDWTILFFLHAIFWVLVAICYEQKERK